MHLYQLILREIAYRKLSFCLSLLAGAAAVACLVSQLVILRKHDAATEHLLVLKEKETQARMAALEDDYRKITLGLGFNVLILPREQNLSDLFAEDYAGHSMPEEYVERLASSRVATIQHLLPVLQRKLKWPEAERMIILMGVRGEVPILQADRRKPILQPVPPGSIVLGWELHRSLKLKQGDKVKLLGQEFTVAKLHDERGTKDDITAWINLRQAQQLLGQPGQINGILALECVCAAESLAKVRTEIARALPDTQVIEFQSQMLARAEARQRAAAEAREALAREKENRARLRQARADFAAWMVPLVAMGSAIWIGFLALANVRERRFEIGLFRAMGLRSWQLLTIFLGRALVLGVLAAVAGCAIGLTVGGIWREAGAPAVAWTSLVSGKWVIAILLGTPLLALMASWLPALTAAHQDPALILNHE